MTTVPAQRARLTAARPPLGDVVLVAGLLATAVYTVGTLGLPRETWPLATGLALVQILPVLWRQHAPLAALGVHVAGEPLAALAGINVGGLAWLVLVYSVAAHRPWRLSLIALAATVAAVPPIVALATPGPGVFVLGAITSVVVQVVVAWGIGAGVRLARSRAARHDERRAQDRLDVVLAAQRSRIGAELHRVVEQRMQRVVDAAAAVTARPSGSAPAGEVLVQIQHEARETMTAMRRMLGLLRSDAPGDVAAEPAVPPQAARRRLSVADASLALGAVALAVLLHLVLPAEPPAGGAAAQWALFRLPPSPAGILVVLLQVLPLAWCRRAPSAALVASTLGVVLAPLVAADNFVGSVVWTALVYFAAAWSRPRIAAVAILLALTGWFATITVVPRSGPTALPFTWGNVAYGTLVTLAVWAAGDLRRRSRAAAEAKQRVAQERREQDGLRRERARIARDLHDVVAHHVSGIAVQAGAARSLATTRPEVTDEALRQIQRDGRDALDALPGLLGAIDPDRPVADAPEQVGTAELDDLVRSLRGAGADVTVEVDGDVGRTAGECAVFTARIVQEALTNVLRHAGPSPTRVRVEHQDRQVLVEVTDAGPAPGRRPAADGSGHGLTGMRERVALVGGELRAGPQPGGGWTVRAVLPH